MSVSAETPAQASTPSNRGEQGIDGTPDVARPTSAGGLDRRRPQGARRPPPERPVPDSPRRPRRGRPGPALLRDRRDPRLRVPGLGRARALPCPLRPAADERERAARLRLRGDRRTAHRRRVRVRCHQLRAVRRDPPSPHGPADPPRRRDHREVRGRVGGDHARAGLRRPGHRRVRDRPPRDRPRPGRGGSGSSRGSCSRSSGCRSGSPSACSCRSSSAVRRRPPSSASASGSCSRSSASCSSAW